MCMSRMKHHFNIVFDEWSFDTEKEITRQLDSLVQASMFLSGRKPEVTYVETFDANKEEGGGKAESCTHEEMIEFGFRCAEKGMRAEAERLKKK